MEITQSYQNTDLERPGDRVEIVRETMELRQ